MALKTLSLLCFFMAIGLIISAYFIEMRIIGLIRREDPENWMACTHFFGQRLKFRALRTAIAEGKYRDPEVARALRRWKSLAYPGWFFLAGFLVFLAAI